MKSIANQYRDLKEGRMSQANFMRNLRMTMPQFVTNVTSFGDAIRILKNKSILNENTNPANQPSEEELAAMVKKMEDEKAGEEAVKAQYDMNEYHSGNPNDKYVVKQSEDKWEVREGGVLVDTFNSKEEAQKLADEKNAAQELNEAKKKEDKVEYSKNQCNPTELRLGIKTELEHGDMELDKAKEIAYKNIAKDPIYYTTLKLSGVEAHPKKVKGEKVAPAKKAKKESAQLVDLVNGMQKVKMPKADEKKKIKESVDEKMRFQDLPADPEKYKIVRDSKNYIIKATNADGVEFQKGDVVKTYDGEEIKIAKFEESQGKVKAIYNKGMFFVGIDIDGLEAPKETFRPGVNIGGSFEKMKRSLEEIVRETISEYFDGRDNLVNPLSAEDENNLNENEEPLPQYATKIATEHNLILMPQPLDSTQLYQMWKKEKGSFGSKEGVMVYDPSMKAVSVLSSDKKTGEAVMTRFIADRSGTPSVDSKPFEEPGSKTAYFKQFIIAG
jgi:hypothetical protein